MPDDKAPTAVVVDLSERRAQRDPQNWRVRCECGCSTWELRGNGEIQCAMCRGIAIGITAVFHD